MGESLFELEQVLRSSKYKITREEEDVLNVCKGKAVREFTLSACIASGIVWTALRRLSYGFRGSLSSGAAVGFGLWRFDRSLSSCVDNILGMEGSRMQKELANILLTRHRHDPSRMKLINKHFYLERVFDDSTTDRPISRWRQRNFYTDGIAPSQKPNESDNSHEHKVNNNGDYTPEARQFPLNAPLWARGAGVGLSVDPFEDVFGNSSKVSGDIVVPETGSDNSGSTKKLTRKEKRRERRHHRARQTRALSDEDNSDAVSRTRGDGEVSSRSGVPRIYEEQRAVKEALDLKKRFEAMREMEASKTMSF